MMRSPRSFAVVCRRPDGSDRHQGRGVAPRMGRVCVFCVWPILARRRGIARVAGQRHLGPDLLGQPANGRRLNAAPAQPRSLGARAANQPRTNLRACTSRHGRGLADLWRGPVRGRARTWPPGAWAALLGFDADYRDLPRRRWRHQADHARRLHGGISLLPTSERVFQYHGAEHKAIFTYEQGLPSPSTTLGR